MHREKEAQHPPQAGRQRGGGTRFGRADDVEASSTQAGASQIVDPMQYQHQHQHEVYQPQHQHRVYEPHYKQADQQEGEAQEEPMMEFEADMLFIILPISYLCYNIKIYLFYLF